MQGYNETLIKPDPMNLSSYYYSQYGQDAFLEEFIFKGKLKEGFFVEAGAADGVLDSNTLVKREKLCFAAYVGLDWVGWVLRFGVMEAFVSFSSVLFCPGFLVEANVINLTISRCLSFSTVGVAFWWKQTHFSLSKVSLREGEPGRL